MRPFLLAAAALLAACSAKVDSDDTGQHRTAKGEAPGTTFAASADAKTGNLKLALPGAKLDIDVPGGLFTDSKMELDGIKLYPGSKIDTMNVTAKDGGEDKDEAKVDIAFTAPADPATVRAWMLAQSAHLKRPLVAVGDGLSGQTREGKPIAVALTPLDGGRTKGAIRVEG